MRKELASEGSRIPSHNEHPTLIRSVFIQRQPQEITSLPLAGVAEMYPQVCSNPPF
jgi:hypothetical protein